MALPVTSDMGNLSSTNIGSFHFLDWSFHSAKSLRILTGLKELIYINYRRHLHVLKYLSLIIIIIIMVTVFFPATTLTFSHSSFLFLTFVFSPWDFYSLGQKKIIITKTMFMVLSSWQSHCESSFDECRMAPSGRWPKTKPDDLGCTGCQKLHPPSPFFIITQPKSWYSFYHPTEGRRLSRPSWLVTYRDGLPSTDGHPSRY